MMIARWSKPARFAKRKNAKSAAPGKSTSEKDTLWRQAEWAAAPFPETGKDGPPGNAEAEPRNGYVRFNAPAPRNRCEAAAD